MTRVTLAQGDITTQRVDVIVNAANGRLLGGGGVDGAIHAAAGPALLVACAALPADAHGSRLATGDAVATPAGRLPAAHVVHTVGPVYAAGEDRSALLRSCYDRSLEVADGLGAGTIAFPLVSAGVYGWPLDDAARIAVETLAAARTASVVEARLVLFGTRAYAAAERALAAVQGR